MTPLQIETGLLVAAVAAACAVPGVFLVLRRMALVSDAIGHVLLFGIVVAYLIVGDLYSPWLMIGAAASGVLTVALVELLQKTGLVKADAAIGLVFPALFSAGTIIASMYFRGTHLDVDSVLLGHAEALYETPKVTAGPIYFGRLPTLFMFAAFVVNSLLTVVFFKELKLSAFDPALAATLGFLPGVMHYGLMGCVSLTAVTAFDAVGPVLVVAFLIVPPMTAYLLSDRLGWVLILSVGIGIVGAFGGVFVAYRLNTNIAGTVAVGLGVIFALAYLFAPGRGLIAQIARRWRQRREFPETMLCVHLAQHEGTPAEADEAQADGLHRHFAWPAGQVDRVVARAERRSLVHRDGALLKLSPAGRDRIRHVFPAS